MIIGVNLPNYSSLGYRDSIIAIAQTAEALGYASLWTNDHVLLPTSGPEPFGNVLESLTTLSYLAASTDRIRLGTGILVLPQRDPLLVAKQAATISHLSGGRLALAVGVGYIKEEYGFLRADFGNRGRLADEYIAAMRELFESDAPEFHGPHITYSDVLFSPQPSPRIHKIQHYGEAGVDRIVIEPVSSDLDDFLRQLSRFADEITPHITRTSA